MTVGALVVNLPEMQGQSGGLNCQLLEGIFLIRIFVASSKSVFVRDVQGNGLIVKLDIMFYIS